MINVFNFLQKDVKVLKKLEKTQNGDSGFFQYYYRVLDSMDKIVDKSKQGYRDEICYEYKKDGATEFMIKFYTVLVHDEKGCPKIIIRKIEGY